MVSGSHFKHIHGTWIRLLNIYSIFNEIVAKDPCDGFIWAKTREAYLAEFLRILYFSLSFTKIKIIKHMQTKEIRF